MAPGHVWHKSYAWHDAATNTGLFCGLGRTQSPSGVRTPVKDSFAPIIEGFAGQALRPHQAAVIDQAAALAATVSTD